MKRIYKIASYVLMALGFLIVGTSCSTDKIVVTKIEMSENANNEFKIGEFNYSDYEVIVTYSDNSTKTITLNETMISNQDYLKTFSEGISTIKISYANISFDYEINVKRFEYDEDIYFKTMDDVIYDGNYHTIEVEGNIPEGTRIIYPNGNSFKNAARYPVTATLVNDLYVTKTISGEFTIKKSVYDISKLEFKNKEFTYDGTEKMIEVKNAPKDLNITYSIGQASTNKAILAGEYTVVAHIDAGVNYEPVDDLTATMTIKKGTYDMSNYKFTNKTVVYNGEVQNIYITNENLLPTGVSVSYENNGNINAGTYEVTAKFISNNVNYEPIEDKKATLTIKKASYTLTGVYLDSDSVAYDGKPHYLYYSGTLPQGVSFEGYVDNGQVNAGVYTVQAKFTYRDANNYEPITPITGILEITKSDLTSITFVDKTVEYSGLNYKLTCGNVPAGVTVNYSIKDRTETSVKEPGTYVFNASFTYDEVAANNFNPLADKQATLFIKKKTLQTGFSSQTVEYDGEPHWLECNLTASEREFISVSYYIYNDKHEYVPFISATEPGSYLIYAEFDIEDESKEEEFYSHYEELYSQCETLIIDKVRYTPVFTNKVLKYWKGVTQCVEYDYDDLANHPKLAFDDIVYTNNQQSEKGVYRATAKFYLTENAKKYYYDVAEQEFMYVIVTNPSVAEETVFPVFDSSTVVYDGNVHSISVSGVPEGIEVDLQNNSQVLPGTHLVTAIFTYVDPVIKHYYDLPKGQGTYYEMAGEEDKVYCTVAFVIEKKLYNVKYTNNNLFAYDGNNKTIEVDPSEAYISATFEYIEEERKIPGTYTVLCIPRITDSTFSQIYRVEETTVQFKIVKADVMFSYTGLTVYYDGKEHFIKVIGLPEGINAITSGDGQTKPGTYSVEISFTKDPEVESSAYYNDIESQLETLTILSNPVSPGAFINYVNEDNTKFVNQFTTLREFVGNWINNLDGFRVDWSCDYFKGPSDEYPITDKARHGSSKNASDFVFSESTVNDDFVMVSIKLTLKEGYEIVDGSMRNTFSTLITLHVGQTIVIDISEFNQEYGESGSVNQNTSWVNLLRDNISDFDLIEYTYTADYYVGNNMYSEEQGNVHGDSTLQDDFIFSVATWGNRTCNVSYTLEVPKGYSLFDGTRSYQKIEKTTKLLVNPLTEVDVNYLNDITNSDYLVVQYTKFSESITNLVDFNHLDVTWSIDDNSNQVINNTTDYIIKNTDDFTCTITVKTKDNFTIRGSSLSEFTKTFTCKVESRPAVDFSDFITKMNGTGDTIIQYFDYFTDIINEVVMPEEADFVITIYDVDGHAFAYEELGTFSVDNYIEGKKLKVDFEFYPSGESLIVDENSYASNYRKFTYEYDIQKALPFDQYLDALENIQTQYVVEGITQFTNIQDIFGNIFDDFVNYDFVDCVYQIDYYDGVDLLLSEDYRNWNEDYIFNKLKIDNVSISDVVVSTYFELDRNGGYIFQTTGYLYSGRSSFNCQINKVNLLNDKITSLVNKQYVTKTNKALYLLDNYGIITSSEAILTKITVKNSLGNIDYEWNSSNTFAYDYSFLYDGIYSVEYSYNTQPGYYYEKDGLAYTVFSYSIDVKVDPRDAIRTNLEYEPTKPYDKFTKITDIVNLYATSPDPKYTKEQFLGGLFRNFREENNTDFIEHLIVTRFSVEYLDNHNEIISTISGYMNSSACLGISCSSARLYVVYAFDNDFMFVDASGNVLGDGLTCTRRFDIKIDETGYEQINTWQSGVLWSQYNIMLAGRTLGDYFYYGLEDYKDELFVSFCSSCGVIQNGAYLGYLNENSILEAKYDYISVSFRLTVVDSSKLYFSITSDGCPVKSYSIDYANMQIRTPILIDLEEIENAFVAAESVKVGKRIFTFTENSNLAYTYYVDQYSHETDKIGWRTTFYTNRSAYFSDKDTTNTPEEIYEITIIMTVRDDTKYQIVTDNKQLLGYPQTKTLPHKLTIYH